MSPRWVALGAAPGRVVAWARVVGWSWAVGHIRAVGSNRSMVLSKTRARSALCAGCAFWARAERGAQSEPGVWYGSGTRSGQKAGPKSRARAGLRACSRRGPIQIVGADVSGGGWCKSCSGWELRARTKAWVPGHPGMCDARQQMTASGARRCWRRRAGKDGSAVHSRKSWRRVTIRS